MATRKTHDPSTAEVLFCAAEILEDVGDMAGAFRCTLAGAKLNHGMSQVNLGNMYAAGAGTKKSSERAAFWYKKAFRNGMVDGAFNLAIDHRKRGDVRSATIWFKKAAAKSHGGAFIALAELYASQSVTKRKAINVLRLALNLTRNDLSDAERRRAARLLEKLRPH